MTSRIVTLFAFSLAFFALSSLSAQERLRREVKLQWEDSPRIITEPESGEVLAAHLYFDGASLSDEHPQWPEYRLRIPLSGPARLQVQILSPEREAFGESLQNLPLQLDQLPSDWSIQTQVARAARKWYGYISIIPLRKTATGYERLTAFSLDIQSVPAPAAQTRNPYNPPLYSRLADGDIYKMAVSKEGVYKLDYNFLKNELGLDPDKIDPRKIEILGLGGGMLPEANSDFRYEDLEACAIYVKGQEDGSFDSGDYILFYAQGADVWYYDEDEQRFRYRKNVYDDKNYYYLKIQSENGLRISSQSGNGASYNTTSYDDYAHHEEELFNLLNSPGHQGSGRQWFGERFYIQREYTYSFDLSGQVAGDTVFFEVNFAGRGSTNSSYKVKHAGSSFTSGSMAGVSLDNPDTQYAFTQRLSGHFPVSTNPIDLTIEYPLNGPGDNEGWLDYITINVRRNLSFSGSQMNFRDKRCRLYENSAFTLANANGNVRVWDVSDPLKPVAREGSLSANTFAFSLQNQYKIPELVAFDESQNLLQPEAIGKIPNQNLHGIADVDMIILYHETFKSQAEQLAAHRSAQGLQVQTVRIDEVYEEFSSGRQDVSAIRDFVRMVYQRDPDFRYLLLIGDGSFDFRNILGYGNHFVPAYETANSLHPIYAYPSDDYFALLDEQEGSSLTGGLDIAVGRLPVQNAQQAQEVVDKIIHYETAPEAMGDWRLRATFLADDEDNAIHMRDCNAIADSALALFPFLNIDKLFVDAYQQEAASFGQRVPGLEKAFNDRIFQGTLTVTYLGHGGWRGWAQERILQPQQILEWENYDRLPLFLTATCSFAGFDDPNNTTAGELVLFNPRGGGVALFTTVRPVYASQNKELTMAATKELYKTDANGSGQPIGNILMDAKNEDSVSDSNSRKFLLLGDPAMRLALPRYQVVTTEINGQPLSNQPDTLSALEQISISGQILDLNGQPMPSFNGTIYPSVFDKTKTYQTLGQDDTPVKSYKLQRNLLFRGRASVQNGAFTFSFLAPKDIDFSYGQGKISYYAANGQNADAGGYSEEIVIGGISPDAIDDDEGPQVEVYMNDENFVFGGMTGESPLLLVKLQDELGINVVGNSIGHDLTAILDEDSENTYLLNNFYEAELDDYTRGSVRYPLENLSEGRHSITVKAWDVANNSSEGYTEFIVAGSAEVALEHVLNYPNPFINSTCFQFEHNMEGSEMEVQVDIYTISGRLVKSLRQKIFATGSRLSNDNCLVWDGTDEFGDPLARGVYIYKVRVQANLPGSGLVSGESNFEKLVILR